MNTKPIDKMTDAELQEELKRRQQAKTEDRDTYRKLVDEIVPELINDLKKLSANIQQTKLAVFENVTGLLELKDKAYGVKDDQRSHTFTTESGDSIKLGYRVRDGWNDTVGAGIAKVNKFLESLAKDDDSAKLVKTINQLLKKDAKGNLKSNRVVELHNLTQEFNDAEFTDGVHIIMKAYKPVQTCFFIEAYQTNANGREISIPLSISSVEFPEGVEFDYFKKPKLEEQ